MSLEQPIVLSSEPENDSSGSLNSSQPDAPRFSWQKILLAAALILALIIFALIIFFVVKKYLVTAPDDKKVSQPVANGLEASSTLNTLPNFGIVENTPDSNIIASSSFSNLSVEYLTFQDFYKAPNNTLETRVNDYKLPLNIKIDVMNYYDISRKFSLDAGLDDLNNRGFTIISNPWPKVTDFYTLYSNISKQQTPLLVTSDFIIYQYQNIFKKVFKDVEQNVFYNNLWDINKEMYTLARKRYENRLAAIGDINDAVLEGERLETVFFAVALELMKPTTNQISSKGSAEAGGLFTIAEADHFYFTVPTYLSNDVKAELKLIREAKTTAKSPVLLYQRNYTDFIVPGEYLADAKLRNFYLTTKWLNSVFPLNYRAKDCATCLLDQTDWRINLTAASLIAQDFSASTEIKSKWARIYKVMSFFKGLREDLNYVHYRDALVASFGADYKIEELFDGQNKDRDANLEKLRAKLLTYNFPEISGALRKDDASDKLEIGFKVLAETYWPNNYIFSRLISPAAGNYIGTNTQSNNITACANKTNNVVTSVTRCNGFAFDAINLIYPIGTNAYFLENTNYSGYSSATQSLREELTKNSVWHWNNYWTTLRLTQSYLSADKNKLPLFTQSDAWQNKSLKTAAAAWINLQLPLEKFSIVTAPTGSNLDDLSRLNENSYIEPNLDLINEILANNNMLLQMFSALQLELDVKLALQDLQNFSNDLKSLQKIISKELNGEKLTTTDNETITNFVSSFKPAASSASKQLAIKIGSQKNILREDLSRFKLLVLVHQEADNKVFSIGPVWDYQESR